MICSLLVLLLALFISRMCCAETRPGLEMFSLDKLAEYNSLVDCFTTIKSDFSACNREAQERGEFALKYIDENSDFGVMLKCCGTWMVRDCWVNAAKDRCHDASVQQLHTLPVKFMPALEKVCERYQPGTVYCYVPHIIVISLFVFVLLIIITAVVAAFIFFRRRYTALRKVDVESEHSNNNEDKFDEV